MSESRSFRMLSMASLSHCLSASESPDTVGVYQLRLDRIHHYYLPVSEAVLKSTAELLVHRSIQDVSNNESTVDLATHIFSPAHSEPRLSN